MEINEEIAYEWKLGWDTDGMPEPKPVVNRLIKAMLEKDVQEMEELFANGAEVAGCNESTFGRALFHVLDDYGVISCLVNNGFTAIRPGTGFSSYYDCYDLEGYCWGLLGRAWNLGAYEVMDLLAQNGFSNTTIHYQDEVYYLERVVFANNDVRAAKILLENGYSRNEMNKDAESYRDSKVTRFLKENPVIHRKSVGLSNYQYSEYPKPKLEKPGLFNRKMVKKHNQILMADYHDYMEAQKRFVNSMGVEEWEKECKDREEKDDLITEVLIELANEPKR